EARAKEETEEPREPEEKPEEKRPNGRAEEEREEWRAAKKEGADKKREPEQEERKARRKEQHKQAARPPRMDEPVPASPSVREFARELGVSIGEVIGTGPGGRISLDDVKGHVRRLLADTEKKARNGPAGLPGFGRHGDVERAPMGSIRRAVARNVATSWREIPHVSQFDEADISELERFQKRFPDQVEEEGGKLTITAILLKVLAMALRRFPEFNASLDMERAELIEKHYVNIGVAVDTPQGLLVPVLHDVDKKGLVEISAELAELGQKARGRKLSRDELQGGSFTLTNLGAFGTLHFTPIIGWPQVAILAVGKARVQPVYRDGEFVPRKILPLGITYDHRAVDGADAARFMRWIVETLEEPLRMTMGATGGQAERRPGDHG
ncbi:MAG: 2-oxo acid dehydrogenase subunit E2, partial [Bradymonadaceae bacterium]